MLKPRDRQISTFGDDELDRVLSAFGFDTYGVLPFFALNGTILDLRRRTETARKALVETSAGVKVLKQTPWYCADEALVRMQTQFQTDLTLAGEPVPQLESGPSGESHYVHDEFSGQFFTLQTYVPGRSWSETADDAAIAGAAIGRMHLSAARLPTTMVPATKTVHDSALGVIDLLPLAYPNDDAVTRLHHVARSTVARTRDRALESGYRDAMQIVHGDVNPFNLVFDDERPGIAAIVDFDNTCVDNPAHDIAEGVARFGWLQYRGLSSGYGAVPSGIDPIAADAFIRGFAQANPTAMSTAAPFIASAFCAAAAEILAIGVLSGYYPLANVDDLVDLVPRLEGLFQASISLENGRIA